MHYYKFEIEGFEGYLIIKNEKPLSVTSIKLKIINQIIYERTKVSMNNVSPFIKNNSFILEYENESTLIDFFKNSTLIITKYGFDEKSIFNKKLTIEDLNDFKRKKYKFAIAKSSIETSAKGIKSTVAKIDLLLDEEIEKYLKEISENEYKLLLIENTFI